MPVSPPNSVSDPVQRVLQLAEDIRPYHLKYERARDARAVFAFAYLNITQDLAKRLADPNAGFADPAWVADLGVAFGRRFQRAMDGLDAWLAGQGGSRPVADIHAAAPRPWADVYLAIRDNQSYVLEDLVFSMMAHISFDLPNAVLEVDHRAARLGDYHRMNDLLADNINEVQRLVAKRYQRFLLFLDRWAGSFDEFLSNYGIRATRAVAWYNAMRLEEPTCGGSARASIERSTALFIQSVREPDPWWLRWLVRVGRALIPRRRRWPPPGE